MKPRTTSSGSDTDSVTNQRIVRRTTVPTTLRAAKTPTLIPPAPANRQM